MIQMQSQTCQSNVEPEYTHAQLAAAYLKYVTMQGMHNRFGDDVPQDVQDRIEMEFGVIIPNHFVDYILMLWDIHEFCRTPDRVFKFCEEQSITPPPNGVVPIGPGRGSVGGSMVCYCIGITQCDPMLFGLFFERFLNPERIAPPDIDFDISQKYRHIGVAYVTKTYGVEYVSQIVTFGTFSKNLAISNVLKIARVPNVYINQVKATVPEDPSANMIDFCDDEKFEVAMMNVPFVDMEFTITKDNVNKVLSADRLTGENKEKAMKVFLGQSTQETIVIENSMDWKKALNIMLRLDKLNKNASVHAAGVVVASVPLETNVPLMIGKDGGLVCQYEKQEVEALGYIKLDMLGLRTVDVNYDAEQMIRKLYNNDFNMYGLRFDDQDSMQIIKSGDTNGIFQIEGTGFTNMMQDLNVGGYEVERFTDVDRSRMNSSELARGDEIHDFMWIAAGMALYRPGPLDAEIEGKTMVQHLCDRKAGREPTIYLFPEEKAYLEETYGILTYQEQVMSRVRQMTGCSYGRADILRKAMGKKDPVLMKEQMDWFKENAINHKFSNSNLFDDIEHKKRIVDRAAGEIETFARYGFNKAHAVEYAIICYQNLYAKSHYPDCFYCALINSLNDKPEKQTLTLRDMKDHGIDIMPPDINKSEVDFVVKDKNIIAFGFGAIKQFGKHAGEILKERDINGEYGCVEQFRLRLPAKQLNKAVLMNLAKCGAFDSLLHNNASDIQFDNRASLVATIDNLSSAIQKIKNKKRRGETIPLEEAISIWENSHNLYNVIPADDDPIQYAVWEKETIKYYISAHPIDAYKDEMRRWGTIQSEDIENMPEEVYIAGFVEDVHETTVKKEGRNKGKKMGFVTIGTEYRLYEATMFPGIYESCIPYLEKGKPVVLKARRDFFRDNWTLQAQYIRNMTNTGIRDCPECHIRLNDPNNALGMMQMKQMFDQHFGTTIVFIHVLDGYNDVTIRLNQTIALNDHIINFVESIGTLAYKPNGVSI